MKKQKTKEQIYKRNSAIAKFLKSVAPYLFWVCIGLGILFLVMAIINSFGNVNEIIDKLNSKAYTGEELRNNYKQLVDKYGEWTIGNGGAGFTITFVNIKSAIFSGIMISSVLLSLVFFVSAFILGKWLIPKLSASITQYNQDMVNLEILEIADKNNCKKE